MKRLRRKLKFFPLITLIILVNSSWPAFASPIEDLPIVSCNQKLSLEDAAKMVYLSCNSKVGRNHKKFDLYKKENKFSEFCFSTYTGIWGESKNIHPIQAERKREFISSLDRIHDSSVSNATLTKELFQKMKLNRCQFSGWNHNVSSSWRRLLRSGSSDYNRLADFREILSKIIWTELRKLKNYLYYVKRHNGDWPTLSAFESLVHKNQQDVTPSKLQTRVSFGYYYDVYNTGESVSSLFLPEDLDKFLFDGAFYDAFSLQNMTSSSRNSSGFKNFDSTTENKWPMVTEKINHLEKCAKNFATGVSNKSLSDKILKKCTTSERIYVSFPSTPNYPIKKSVRKRKSSGFFGSFGDDAYHMTQNLAYLRDKIGLEDHWTQAGEIILREYDPIVLEYLKKLRGWSDARSFKSLFSSTTYVMDKIKEYQNFAVKVMLAETKEDKDELMDQFGSWLVQDGIDIIIALGLFEVQEYKLPYLTDRVNVTFLGMTDFEDNLLPSSLSQQMKSVVDGFDFIDSVASLMPAPFSKEEIKAIILRHFEVLKDFSKTPEMNPVLDELLSRSIEDQTDIFKSISVGERLSRTINQSNPGATCSVMELIATRKQDSRVFQQVGVVTVVKWENQDRWITPAHVVEGATSLEARCGEDKVMLKVVNIDSKKDTAEVTPMGEIAVTALPAATEFYRPTKYLISPQGHFSSLKNAQIFRLRDNVEIALIDNFIGSPYLGIDKLMRIKGFGIRPGMSGGPLLNNSGEVKGLVTHMSRSSDHSLALRISDFFTTNDLKKDVKTTFVLSTDQVLKYHTLTVRLGGVKEVLSDRCSFGSFRPVGHWNELTNRQENYNSGTDWGGGSGSKKLPSGNYFMSRASIHDTEGSEWARFIPSEQLCQSGVNIRGRTLVGIKAKGALSKLKEDVQIHSVIDLAQLLQDHDLKTLLKSAVWDDSPLTFLCDQRENSFLGNKFVNISGYISSGSSTFRVNNSLEGRLLYKHYDLIPSYYLERDAENKLYCSDDSFIIEDSESIQLSITKNHINGEVKVGKCQIEIDASKDNFYNGYFSTDLASGHIFIENYPQKQVRLMFTNISPNCFGGSETDIYELIYKIKNK